MAGPYIFIFTGTSGSGRKTMAHRIGKELGIKHVSSYTTRPPRDSEPPDRDYHYIEQERFDRMNASGDFIEIAAIHKHHYGIRTHELTDLLSEGKHVYMILNSDGASLIKKLYGEQVVRIFLYVEKRTVIERLEAKGLPAEVINNYISIYTEEVVYRKQCEHVLENLDLNRTMMKIREAIQSHL
ncbi:guanylate kinase [Paenibacillus sp. FSL H8-0537]|uniref:guanylate kinase n=1 Tax=Paenibacillus sp. FSL H8-0537 TaxID=2921399 RepID=UPI003100E6DC